ncbi:hypothetical protein TNIN_233891 [Trichonephila inaurata madagascariensis]|uniref:Uncharacterized protein n=1 Tax=Trichonephila inaurata madagascariensis TaxID=2747483 RepID=A0A8X6I6D5_9ARAC|nr:hypothetical protein TNIN_233891 [Trichonephila inaurata madagascariensis]
MSLIIIPNRSISFPHPQQLVRSTTDPPVGLPIPIKQNEPSPLRTTIAPDDDEDQLDGDCWRSSLGDHLFPQILTIPSRWQFVGPPAIAKG